VFVVIIVFLFCFGLNSVAKTGDIDILLHDVNRCPHVANLKIQIEVKETACYHCDCDFDRAATVKHLKSIDDSGKFTISLLALADVANNISIVHPFFIHRLLHTLYDEGK
jgi:cadmium resistance protein CadD (predicted permease)